MRYVKFTPQALEDEKDKEFWAGWLKRAERAKAKAAEQDAKREKIKFNDTVWKDLKVWLLEHHFHNKCAYCEGKYIAGTYDDAEHWRPKGMVTVKGVEVAPFRLPPRVVFGDQLPDGQFAERRIGVVLGPIGKRQLLGFHKQMQIIGMPRAQLSQIELFEHVQQLFVIRSIHFMCILVVGSSCLVQVWRIAVKQRIGAILLLDDLGRIVAQDSNAPEPDMDLRQSGDSRQPSACLFVHCAACAIS